VNTTRIVKVLDLLEWYITATPATALWGAVSNGQFDEAAAGCSWSNAATDKAFNRIEISVQVFNSVGH
jgi:hypothetical protein